jgi:hypothetical protein
VQILTSVALRDGGNQFIHPWHIDRHRGDCDTPRAAHPRYHMSFGGRALEGHFNALGRQPFGVVFLDAPRIACPPMDLILAVDFVLSHFCGAIWRDLRAKAQYQACIRDSQRRLWRPYASALAKYWDSTPGGASVWRAADLWPSLIS